MLETQCPHCDRIMELKSREAIGKKARCPKCQNVFRIQEIECESLEDYEVENDKPAEELSEEEPVELSFDDEADSLPRQVEDYDDFAIESPSQPRRSKSVKAALLIGGGVLGAVAIGLCVWLLMRKPHEQIDLAWLPSDADSLTVKRPADEWEKTAGSSIPYEAAEKILAAERQQFGVCQTDIISITTAMKEGRDRISVVRTSADIAPEKIIGRAEEPQKLEHSGQEYYLIRNSFRSVAIFFPDRRTVIYGTEKSVKAAIDRGATPAERDELKFVDAGFNHVEVDLSSGWSTQAMIAINTTDNSRPVASAEAKDVGGTTVRWMVRVKFATKSEAANALDATVLNHKNLAHSRRTEASQESERQRLRLLVPPVNPNKYAPTVLKYTEDEIEDELNCQEKRFDSWSASRSGTVVSVEWTNYVSKYKLRVKEYDRKRHDFPANILAGLWFERTFGFPPLSEVMLTYRRDQAARTEQHNATLAKLRKSTLKHFVTRLTYDSFSGKTNPSAAVKTALADLAHLDLSQTVVNVKKRTVSISRKIGAAKTGGNMFTLLRQAGFEGIRVDVSGFRRTGGGKTSSKVSELTKKLAIRNRTRVSVHQITIVDFTGKGDRVTAAKKALGVIDGLDANGAKLDAAQTTLTFGTLPGKRFKIALVAEKLSAAGFTVRDFKWLKDIYDASASKAVGTEKKQTP